ncbi:hypothetical protein [Nonomuraea sp. B19D2]|uniref:hypothetical protein n=1 Tax=Nonomuraea sp. B19D2 TaxID=3159561 RepID=UPI0032DAACEE
MGSRARMPGMERSGDACDSYHRYAEEQGWMGERAIERFRAYVQAVAGILDGVEWVCTINEPNMLALMVAMGRVAQSGDAKSWMSPTVEGAARPVLPNTRSPAQPRGTRMVRWYHTQPT